MKITIVYKDFKRPTDIFDCDSYGIDRQNSLIKFYRMDENNVSKTCILIRLPEIVKMEIS